MTDDTLPVLVLMGGASPEREVSLETGRAVFRHLDRTRFLGVAVEVDRAGHLLVRHAEHDTVSLAKLERSLKLPAPLTRAHATLPELLRGFGTRSLESAPVALVLVALHGRDGEDGRIQGVLELIKVPFTGSGVTASALGMDKHRSRQLFAWNGLSVPKWIVVQNAEWSRRETCVEEIQRRIASGIGYPCIVKPNACGSSIGVTLIRQESELASAIDIALSFDAAALVEEYIVGRELTCGLMLNSKQSLILPTVEIRAKGRAVFDYEAKYTPGLADEIIPAPIPDSVQKEAIDAAVTAYNVLGCAGLARVDLIATTSGVHVLEVNTIPGLTPNSLCPKAAAAMGVSFSQLLTLMIEDAIERWNGRDSTGERCRTAA